MRVIAHQAGNFRICGDSAFYGFGQLARIGKAAAMKADIDFEAGIERNAARLCHRDIFGEPQWRIDQPLHARAGIACSIADDTGELADRQRLSAKKIGIGVKGEQLPQHLGAEHHQPVRAHARHDRAEQLRRGQRFRDHSQRQPGRDAVDLAGQLQHLLQLGHREVGVVQRQLLDEHAQPLLEAGPSRPVEVLGLSGVPLAVMIVAAALPIGANVFLFAQRYEVAQDLTTASMGLSTVVALFTLSAAMAIMGFIG